MRIGDLARAAGVNASRVRYYESIGLIRAADRQRNGYRDYPPETIQALMIITAAQRAGFTLDQIRDLIPDPRRADWGRGRILASLRQKLAEIEALLPCLERTHHEIEVVIDRVESMSAEDAPAVRPNAALPLGDLCAGSTSRLKRRKTPDAAR